MLKYQRELERTLNRFFKLNDWDCKSELATDFAYGEDTDTIYFGLMVSETAKTIYENLLVKWGLEYDCGVFTTLMLHEVGHYHTIDNFYGIKYKLNMLAKNLLVLVPNDKLKNLLYFCLPIEKSATKWAINYINENHELVDNFDEVFTKKFERFVELNHIDDDDYEFV